jgi:hypothetical protein
MRYSSDLSDPEFALIFPVLPTPRDVGAIVSPQINDGMREASGRVSLSVEHTKQLIIY